MPEEKQVMRAVSGKGPAVPAWLNLFYLCGSKGENHA